MTRDEWINKIKLSCIPLKQIDEQRMPVKSASGCIVSYYNKKVLLTVQHATGNMEDWVIEIKYVPGQGMKSYRIGPMMFLKEGNFKTGQWRDVDFSYAIVPDDIQPFYQEISETNLKITKEVPKIISAVDFNITPDKKHKYGFYGQTRISRNDKKHHVYAHHSIEIDMRFIDIKDDMYIFKLSQEYQGHDYYRGCSGAPIINDTGDIVALVVQGCVADNIIYGIALKQYKTAIDIECGVVK